MIDRIEELLAGLAAEDEEEQEREDVLALPQMEESVPASPRGNEGEAGDGGTGDRSGGRTVEEIVSERPGLVAGVTEESETGDRSGGRTAGEIVLERPGLAAGETETVMESAQAGRELWKDGPVWMVRSRSPEMDEAQRAAAAQRTDQAEQALQPVWSGDWTLSGWEWAVRHGAGGPAPDSAGQPGPARSGPEQAGLKGLYRQTVQGLRPAAPALPPEQAGRTVRAQEPGSAASLAVDELDRAVRRDSRRYDGGMSIY